MSRVGHFHVPISLAQTPLFGAYVHHTFMRQFCPGSVAKGGIAGLYAAAECPAPHAFRSGHLCSLWNWLVTWAAGTGLGTCDFLVTVPPEGAVPPPSLEMTCRPEGQVPTAGKPQRQKQSPKACLSFQPGLLCFPYKPRLSITLGALLIMLREWWFSCANSASFSVFNCQDNT